jgi:hypothetical protein
VKRHIATVMSVVLIAASPHECFILRIMHHASIIQTVKKTGTQRRDSCASIHVYFRLVNVYRTHHQPSAAWGKTYQKIED